MRTAVAPRITTRRSLPAEPLAAPPTSGIAFVLFLAVNATLFIRPAEFIPDLHEINIFFLLIMANLALAFPTVLHQLSPAVLDRRPITTCILGLLLAAVLSHVAHSRLVDGVEKAIDFFKVVVYYLLLISLIDTPQRLRTFVLCILFFATLTVLLAVLDFHKVIALPKI